MQVNVNVSPMRRGFVGRFTLAPYMQQAQGVGFLIFLYFALAIPAGVILQLLGLGFLSGLNAAFDVVVFGAIVLPFIVWFVGGIRQGRFGDLYSTQTDGLITLQGVVFGGLALLIAMDMSGSVSALLGWFFGVTAGFISLTRGLSGRQVHNGLKTRSAAPAAPARPVAAYTAPAQADAPFTLKLGTASGVLRQRGHFANIEKDAPVVFDLESACMNTIIFGGTGGGKTSRVINPLLLQVLRQDAGALIFDIKTNFINQTRYLASQAGRDFSIIGDGGAPFNLLEGTEPELAADFLNSAFLITEGNDSGSGFWIKGAVEYCRNALGLLWFRPEHYSLNGLFRYLFDVEFQTTINDSIDEMRAAGVLDAQASRLIETNLFYFSKLWEPKEEKEKAYIRSTVQTVLSPFQHPSMVDAFCTMGEGQARLENMVNAGTVYLVEIPQTKFGKEGSRIAYLFIKLRFMHMMKGRVMRKTWNQTRPVVYLCDEYQAIIDPISDADFWDKSRESLTVGIISTQGYVSFIKELGGEDTAGSIVQHFRQRISFRTEDPKTLDLLADTLGETDHVQMTHSRGTSNSESQGNNGGSSGMSFNESSSFTQKQVLDRQVMRSLGPDQAVALLNVRGYSYDDVINVEPLYVPKQAFPEETA